MLDKSLYIKRVIKNARKYRPDEVSKHGKLITIPLNFIPDGINDGDRFENSLCTVTVVSDNLVIVLK